MECFDLGKLGFESTSVAFCLVSQFLGDAGLLNIENI